MSQLKFTIVVNSFDGFAERLLEAIPLPFVPHKIIIVIAGTSYVGLSNAILLAHYNQVIVPDVVPEKVEILNRKQSPIEDTEIEDYLKNKPLNFKATLDKHEPYPGLTTLSSLRPRTTIPRSTTSTSTVSVDYTVKAVSNSICKPM